MSSIVTAPDETENCASGNDATPTVVTVALTPAMVKTSSAVKLTSIPLLSRNCKVSPLVTVYISLSLSDAVHEA